MPIDLPAIERTYIKEDRNSAVTQQNDSNFQKQIYLKWAQIIASQKSLFPISKAFEDSNSIQDLMPTSS